MQDPLQASLRTLTLYHIGDNSAFVKLIKYFLFYRDAHCGAKYFTYDTEKSKCRCKPDMNLDVTRREKSGRISGNVECVAEGPGESTTKITAESSTCDLAGPIQEFARQCTPQCGLPLTVNNIDRDPIQ